ncbi:MAG: hypothetical protein ACXAE3_13750 [Candidatus Kariarchaeaceae archaeon]
MGFGSLQVPLAEIDPLSENFILSFLIALGGLFLIGFGIIYLSNGLWEPLENISEYSAEFGSNFIATRLPEAGGSELRRFSERFNQNTIKLSNSLSEIEINAEIVTERMKETVSASNNLADITSSLNDIRTQYSVFSADQDEIITVISEQINHFVNWYANALRSLGENFVELRSLAEMGNLIAINAAVESANMDETNPGIEILANRLRELARSLEERQINLRRILDDSTLNFEEFRTNIADYVSRALNVTSRSSELSIRVDEIVTDITAKELDFKDQANSLERSIDTFKSNIPTSYA